MRNFFGNAKPCIPRGQRVYAIGDVHGCADLLSKLHKQIETDLRGRHQIEPIIIYLGDYVDRGPDSAAVFETLSHPPPDLRRHVLKGNHEMLLQRFLEFPQSGASWLQEGGLETLQSYGVDVLSILDRHGYTGLAEAFSAALPDHHKKLLAEMQISVTIGDYFFCHAGVRPGIALDRQSPADLLWIRDAFITSRVRFGKVIVHGHTPVATAEIHPNRIAIDTKAYESRRLTCLILQGTEQSLLST